MQDVTEQERNPHNPFVPAVTNNRDAQPNLPEIEFPRISDPEREFRILRQEQQRWLDTYQALIGNMWNPRQAYIYGDPDDDWTPEEQEARFWATEFPLTGDDEFSMVGVDDPIGDAEQQRPNGIQGDETDDEKRSAAQEDEEKIEFETKKQTDRKGSDTDEP